MLLQALSDARGVSGDERAVRELILNAVRPWCDETRVDALGNLICLRKARRTAVAAPRRVMLDAHMDEIGLIITGINGDGTLRFGKVGGIDDRILLSKQVLVGPNAVPGVIGFRPIHLLSAAEREKPVSADEMAIDIGVTSKGGAEKLVKPGQYVTFRTSYVELQPDGPRTVKGKAFDDRAGCAIVAELLQGDYAFDLVAAFTAQEEVGLRGAHVAAYSIAPDVAFAFEGTVCDDLPRKKDITPVTELGKGPVFTFMDRSFVADPRLVRLLVRAAEALGLPYQFKRAVAGGTDAGAIHQSREGVPSAAIALPARYIHAPVSMISLVDFENTIAIAREALRALEGGLSA